MTPIESRLFQLQELREYKVVKANELIQRSRFSLTAQEHKIISYLISKIKPDDYEFHLFEFKIGEFCEVCGIDHVNGKNYINLKSTIKKLSDKSLWVKSDDGKKEILFRWVDDAVIDYQNGTVLMKINERMKSFLLQVKEKFTQYGLYYTLPMKSQYSMRLYELFKSWEYIGWWRAEVEELKRNLFAETYKRYPDFKRKVIDTAIRETNVYGDINVSYTVEKRGNKVTHIVFQIKTKTDILERAQTYAKIDEVLNK